MAGTYYDPTTSYAGGGLDRETGQNIPAALWQRLMDMLEFLSGGAGTWTDFTPTLAQNGARTITVDHARYYILGKRAFLELKVTITNAGTAGNPIIIGAIPAAIAPTRFGTSANIIGVGVFNDISVNIYGGLAIAITASTIQLLACDNTGIGAYMGAQGPNVAVANGDVVSINCSYEIA
jgi:hypothetical protein